MHNTIKIFNNMLTNHNINFGNSSEIFLIAAVVTSPKTAK